MLRDYITHILRKSQGKTPTTLVVEQLYNSIPNAANLTRAKSYMEAMRVCREQIEHDERNASR